jgi:hypothetical protein
MNDYSNFIHEAPYMLAENNCKHLIQYFENNKQLCKENYIEINETSIDDPHIYEIINEIYNVFDNQFKIYFSKLSEFYNIHHNKFGTSQIRIEKQSKGQQVGDKHELTPTSLVYLFFLNNIDNGGDMCFFNDKTIKAETGKLILFPKEWFLTFKEHIPISDDKYILYGELLYM